MTSALDGLPVVDGFRQRGLAPTRLETFIDAGFAFSLTLLVIAQGELPRSMPDLVLALKHIPAFAACFALIAKFWSAHNRWSRRFGIEDTTSTLYSLGLMFVALVYVYPLKVVFTTAFHFMSGRWLPDEFDIKSSDELEWLFVIYGVGFVVLGWILVRLNQFALKRRTQLELDEIEVHLTRQDIGSDKILAASGVASIAVALLLIAFPPSNGLVASVPGFIYSSMAFLLPMYHGRMERERKALEARRAGAQG